VRVALIGAGGQLATELAKRFDDLTPVSHAEMDVRDRDAVFRVLGDVAPDLVLNTAAYNLVDRAETDLASAFATNAIGAGHVAAWCGESHARLVHFSTDYVFGGTAPAPSSGWTEGQIPAPVNAYGLSKWAGERLVQHSCPNHLIIRSCGLYGVAATKSKGNFVQTILRLARERPEVRVVADQKCTPTSARDLAKATTRLIEQRADGLIHFTNSGDCSWFQIAREAVRLAGLTTPVVPISTSEYPTAARRPANSLLDCTRYSAVTDETPRPWQDALAEYVASLA
jgi:dTDP-4-dehydrorhamnose reductase